MVYPKLGFAGKFTRHTPLSLLYASIELVKAGIEVEILDNRLHVNTWQKELAKRINNEVLVVGISVMSGKPILNAVEIGKLVKELDPEIKIVWGGPHATFSPDTILEGNWHCDYVVSGYGSKSFNELVNCLLESKEPDRIAGVSYKHNGENVRTPVADNFEYVDYREIPYHLIKDYSAYGQLESDKTIFSMYSVMGCPYKCTFCSSPAQYSSYKKKWVPIEVSEVVGHIEYVIKNYGANYIYFIDDDSFVNLDHVESIIEEIKERGIRVSLGFRGARINEIKKMSDEFLNKLASAGTDIMHVGVESGSNRMLELFRKNCTVDDIIECNQKFAGHPEIQVAYNFIVGIPTETMEDLDATRKLVLQLVKDNPRCIIFMPNTFRPLPGTALFDLVNQQWNYETPRTIAEWINIEAEGRFMAPWVGKKEKQFSKLLILGSYFVDRKVARLLEGKKWFYKAIRWIDKIYGPFIRFRYRHGLYRGLFEFSIYQFVMDAMAGTGTVPKETAVDNPAPPLRLARGSRNILPTSAC